MSNRRPRGRSGRRGRRASGQPRMPANQADQAQQQEQGQPEAPNPPANLNAVPPPGQPIVGGVGPNQQRPAFNPFNQQQQRAPFVRLRLVRPNLAQQQPQQQQSQPIAAPSSQAEAAQAEGAQAEGAQAEVVPQRIVLIHKEVDSFYPYLHHNRIKDSHTVLMYCDHEKRLPEETRNNFEERFNFAFKIRVPALMYVQIVCPDVTTDNNIVADYFVRDDQNREPIRSYRKQCGYHVFIDATKRPNFEKVAHAIERVITSWQWDDTRTPDKWDYNRWTDTRAPISSIYPAMRLNVLDHASNVLDQKAANFQRDPELLLGLLFRSDETTGNRYHQRSYERRENTFRSRNVEDITESFIELIRDDVTPGPRDYLWKNDVLFPTNADREAVAVYVCRAARLLVFDDSLYRWNEQNNTLVDGRAQLGTDGITRPRHNRSLFQQGSLVVVSNCKLELAMQIYKGDKLYSHSYMDYGNENPILPDIYTGEPPLCNLQKKVLFIGANDSMHNSICWQLQVRRKEGMPYKYVASLVAPEGGRLLDVANWNQGFKQIYWRHRSERLAETMTVRSDGQTSMSLALDFQLPANDVLLRRIHGIQNANEMNVPFPVPVPNGCTPLPTNHWQIEYDQTIPASEQTDCDVRRYIDYSRYSSVEMPSVLRHHWGKGYDKWAQVTREVRKILPPPPHYPPIYVMNADGRVSDTQYLLKRGIFVMAEIKNQKVYCHIDWPENTNKAGTFPNRDDNYLLNFGSKYEVNMIPSPRAHFGLPSSFKYRLGTDMLYYDLQRRGFIGYVNKWYLVKEETPN